MNCVRPRYMGMMSRFLVLSAFVVFRSFAVVGAAWVWCSKIPIDLI
jgi:hypothetical protein